MRELTALVLVMGALSARGEFSPAFEPDAIRAVARAALDRQRADSPKPNANWRDAVFLIGWAEWARVDGREEDWRALHAIARRLDWHPGSQQAHPDDQAITQLYLVLHDRDRDPDMLKPTRAVFERVVAGERRASWSWCDALFMAPPALAQLSAATGDPRFLQFMTAEWRSTAEQLYDPEHRLYYRDTLRRGREEQNGEPVFWLRGNGWVLAALARVLPYLPADHPDRGWFVEHFREMSARVIELQSDDGLWRPGLLHPERYRHPESSGSALLLYGLAWGARSGLLDRAAVESALRRGWAGLVRCVHPDGRLGYVQKPAAGPRPRVEPEDTAPYGVGALLLAASEAYRLASNNRE